MNTVRQIQRVNERELQRGLTASQSSSASWHDEFRGSAYVHVGGFPYELTEGDLLCVMSQYGEIVDINLVRDKKTNKSLGYCFIAYEDQRSTVLAVDNLNGIKIGNRTIRVDHVKDYRLTKDLQEAEPLLPGQTPLEAAMQAAAKRAPNDSSSSSAVVPPSASSSSATTSNDKLDDYRSPARISSDDDGTLDRKERKHHKEHKEHKHHKHHKEHKHHKHHKEHREHKEHKEHREDRERRRHDDDDDRYSRDDKRIRLADDVDSSASRPVIGASSAISASAAAVAAMFAASGRGR
ncbi:RNA-binding protein [Capsaspora owczarzaki ATCC 30864]|uniref:RNA-binding protein n=1 Tax=Capsaspora owczarzaki (strain ATCC 30864) TaxID=595528 RepID=A0A0D2X0A8_CAPO3|nr:RNA-binding protein [Capsaspora owczarzaki ATCC 30864]KJE88734.1 RNA-binding protein [Capsaspora owczarzaki ATCC 30864]|eukprot:XP_004365198.1 RNA-binding protein [Capsaspora owczarzaki ATCC 30864]